MIFSIVMLQNPLFIFQNLTISFKYNYKKRKNLNNKLTFYVYD